MRALITALLGLCLSTVSFAEQQIVNVYTWADNIPRSVAQDFERETGIHINIMSFESNESMLAKLKSSREMQFDLVEPSNFYLDIMKKQKLLAKLNTHDFPELANINKRFRPKGNWFYSVPYFTGATGILVNDQFHNPDKIKRWSDLWKPLFKHRLLLLNEPREIFSIALLMLGLDPNSESPTDIKKAYKSLVKLFPNIKLFNSDALLPLYIDEDITIGMIWNVDASKAHQENAHLKFIYPEDGFMIYQDCFAITRQAPHLNNAKILLRYLLRSDVAAKITLATRYSVTNEKSVARLPAKLKEDTMIFPDEQTMKRGILQTSISQHSIKFYGQLWERLKLRH